MYCFHLCWGLLMRSYAESFGLSQIEITKKDRWIYSTCSTEIPACLLTRGYYSSVPSSYTTGPQWVHMFVCFKLLVTNSSHEKVSNKSWDVSEQLQEVFHLWPRCHWVSIVYVQSPFQRRSYRRSRRFSRLTVSCFKGQWCGCLTCFRLVGTLVNNG